MARLCCCRQTSAVKEELESALIQAEAGWDASKQRSAAVGQRLKEAEAEVQYLQTALEAAEEQSSQQADRAEHAAQLLQVTAGGVWSVGKLFVLLSQAVC